MRSVIVYVCVPTCVCVYALIVEEGAASEIDGAGEEREKDGRLLKLGNRTEKGCVRRGGEAQRTKSRNRCKEKKRKNKKEKKKNSKTNFSGCERFGNRRRRPSRFLTSVFLQCKNRGGYDLQDVDFFSSGGYDLQDMNFLSSGRYDLRDVDFFSSRGYVLRDVDYLLGKFFKVD